MRKFGFPVILIFVVALMVVACGTTNKKGNEEVKAGESGGPNEEKDDWITEWIKSNSSDDEICAVGIQKTSDAFMGDAMQMAIMRAHEQLCVMIAGGKEECKLPPSKEKGWRQDNADENGRFSIYVLVCVDRKDLEENKKESEETTSGTDNTDETDKTDEDKVVQ